MFYDDVFKLIIEDSAFSEVATLTIGENSFELKGFFCSGNYGEVDFLKGYASSKTKKMQSFQVSKQSLPVGIEASMLMRKTLSIHDENWVINDIVGNDSGILKLQLAYKRSN